MASTCRLDELARARAAAPVVTERFLIVFLVGGALGGWLALWALLMLMWATSPAFVWGWLTP